MTRVLKSISILFIFGFLFLALYPKEIFLKFCAWKIAQEMQGHCSWDSLEWHQDHLVIKEFFLKKEPFYEIHIDALELYPFSKVLNINDLKFVCHKYEPHFPFEVVKGFLKKTQMKSTISHGNILLYDHYGKGPYFQKIALSFQNNELELSFEEKERLAVSFQDPKLVACDIKTLSFSRLYSFLHFFCDSYFPCALKDWEISSGKLSGLLSLNDGFKKLGGSLDLENFRGRNEEISLLSRLDHAKTSFSIDCDHPERGTLDLSIKEGCLSLLGGHPESWEGIWDFHLFNADILLKDGKVESSSITTNLLGMEGEIALKYLPDDPLFRVKFFGSAKKMVTLIPEPFQKKFASAFPDDDFILSANIKKTPLGFDLEGELSVNTHLKKNRIDFGCHLGKGETKKGSHLLSGLKEQFSFSEKRVGWFKGNDFELSKFLSPFLFSEKELHLSGSCDFEGSFDERFLAIYYKGRNIELEAPQFSLKCPELKEGLSQDIVACHYIDLHSFDHVGILPIKKGDYLQKNLNLHFHDSSFSAFFENNKIDIRDVKTEVENLKLKGNVKLDLQKVGTELKITTSSVSGDLSSACSFLSHIFPHSLWQLAQTGFVESGLGSTFLHFKFEPKAKLLDAFVRTKVLATYKTDSLELKDYECEVEYDKNASRLEFRNGGGSLKLGNTCYDVKLPLLSFFDFPQPEIKGELYLNDGAAEIFKLLGFCTKKNFFIDGNGFSLHGLHDKGSLLVESFKFGKIGGKASVDWKSPNIAIAVESLKVEGRDQEVAFNCFVDKKPFQDVKKEGLNVKAAHFSVAGIPNSCRLGNLHLDFEKQHVKIEDHNFSLSENDLFIIESLATSFVPKTKGFFTTLSSLKRDQLLEGKVSASFSPGGTSLGLRLRNGIYHFKNQDLDLRNVLIHYNEKKVQLRGDLFFHDQLFNFEVTSDKDSEFREGVVAVFDQDRSEPCLIQWKRSQEGDVAIEGMQGKLSGLDFHLRKKNQKELFGQISIDTKRAVKLLSQDLQKTAEPYSLEGNYLLDGDFAVDLVHLSDFSFNGILHAENFGMWGIKLEKMSALLSYAPGELSLKHLIINDLGGIGQVENATLMKGDQGWKVAIPHLKLEKVLLSKFKSDLSKKNKKHMTKPFFISFFRLDHFEGQIGDEESFKGCGSLNFVHVSPKNFLSNILYLPKEITARIGLDLNLLVPARGEITYEIKNGKIHLEEFKGVYSEGKRSRFYLAEGYPATIDFDGALNLKVKMKQYNLLMKVAELFVVTVKGDIFKPVYTLNEEKEDEDP